MNEPVYIQQGERLILIAGVGPITSMELSGPLGSDRQKYVLCLNPSQTKILGCDDIIEFLTGLLKIGIQMTITDRDHFISLLIYRVKENMNECV